MADSEWAEMAPFPGSNDAIAAGCMCPIIDNARGSLELAKARGGFVVVSDCPIHGFGMGEEI